VVQQPCPAWWLKYQHSQRLGAFWFTINTWKKTEMSIIYVLNFWLKICLCATYPKNSFHVVSWCNNSSATCHELITVVDETLFYGCDVEAWQSSSQWKSELSPDLKRYHLYMKLNVRTVFFFLTVKVWCLMRSLLEVKQWIKKFTWLFKAPKGSAVKEITS